MALAGCMYTRSASPRPLSCNADQSHKEPAGNRQYVRGRYATEKEPLLCLLPPLEIREANLSVRVYIQHGHHFKRHTLVNPEQKR
jgi:hypothetical protein